MTRMIQPSNALLSTLMSLCEKRYDQLVNRDGCTADVARDRTYDCLQAALGEVEHCCDPRDRLFESKLRTAAERIENAENQLG